MKRILSTLTALLLCSILFAQNDLADNILGEYSGRTGQFHFHARISRSADGTYRADVIHVDNLVQRDGSILRDIKNPDKSLRDTPADRIVIFTGLQYYPQQQRWGGTKIYDPRRGIKAPFDAWFTSPDKLNIKGSLLGVSKTVCWTRLK
jgi:uncharacterized protein (DUF2147 family)